MKWIAVVLLLAGCPGKKHILETPPAPVDASVDSAVASPDASAPTPPVTPAFCANRPEKAGPFVLDATLAAQRRGTGAKTYADVDSTKAQPIEVCGMEGARIWLEATKCPDGSVGVQGGRFDSVGRGGRCDTMIERFKVGCPDGTLNIVFAVHFCGPNEVM